VKHFKEQALFLTAKDNSEVGVKKIFENISNLKKQMPDNGLLFRRPTE